MQTIVSGSNASVVGGRPPQFWTGRFQEQKSTRSAKISFSAIGHLWRHQTRKIEVNEFPLQPHFGCLCQPLWSTLGVTEVGETPPRQTPCWHMWPLAGHCHCPHWVAHVTWCGGICTETDISDKNRGRGGCQVCPVWFLLPAMLWSSCSLPLFGHGLSLCFVSWNCCWWCWFFRLAQQFGLPLFLIRGHSPFVNDCFPCWCSSTSAQLFCRFNGWVQPNT